MQADRWAAKLQFDVQREEMQADREAAQAERKAARDAALSDRFTRAIDHLKDESLAIRMGALFELKKIGLEAPDNQKDIVRILGPFIQEEIENRELLEPRHEYDLPRPKEDIFIAGEIVSLFYEQTGCIVHLMYLEAKKLNLIGLQLNGADLRGAKLQGAMLSYAQLQGAILDFAQLQGTNLVEVQFQGASLSGAKLQGALISAEQLLEAINVEYAYLDDDLRAEYNRLKAEQPPA